MRDVLKRVSRALQLWSLGPEPYYLETNIFGESVKRYPHRNLSVSGERLPSERDPWQKFAR
jgi:hypothetical protein